MIDAVRKAVLGMTHSRIRNYIAPGLTSWLVGGEGCGKVRLFTSDRDTREWITPHSHRFDFTCLVLAGEVTNILFQWEPAFSNGNRYAVGTLRAGGLGTYEFEPGTGAEPYSELSTVYRTGDTYSMKHDEIHTIRFSRGCAVLFFEGPEVAETSKVLEPWSDGRRVPTFVTMPWMFDRASEIGESEPQ